LTSEIAPQSEISGLDEVEGNGSLGELFIDESFILSGFARFIEACVVKGKLAVELQFFPEEGLTKPRSFNIDMPFEEMCKE